MNRKIHAIIILLSFALLISGIALKKPMGNKEVTWTPLFQTFGKFVQTTDAILSRMLAGGEWDEATFGKELKKKLKKDYPSNRSSRYLNQLMQDLNITSRKDFEYEIFVDPYMPPNAYAMPGGAIVFSEDLLELLETEAQVVAILAHEVAHIELDHCVNAAKFELAQREYNLDQPEIFTFLYQVLIGLSFSKTQEDEADDYAFNHILKNTDYWPLGLSEGFGIFLEEFGKDRDVPILVEFFQSHPDMAYRRDKYYEKALAFAGAERRYKGYTNLDRRRSKTQRDSANEWMVFPGE